MRRLSALLTRALACDGDPAAWCAARLEYAAANMGTPGAANPPCR